MKFTKNKLKQIIKEEFQKLMQEEEPTVDIGTAEDESVDATEMIRAKLNALVDQQTDLILGTPKGQFDSSKVREIGELHDQIQELSIQLAELEGTMAF
tara:strand:- start:655 stop:948 length:294 start_codon:yes stop_codon:yes gene_type:complete